MIEGPSGNLRAFISELRARLKRGDFHGQRDLWLGNELTLLDVEAAVRDLLAEVDCYAAMPPQQREQYPWKGRGRSWLTRCSGCSGRWTRQSVRDTTAPPG